MAAFDGWSEIQPGDRVFFGRYGHTFSKCGIVSDTIEDKSIAVRLWGDTPRMRQMSHLILFSLVYRINEPFTIFCRTAGIESPPETGGAYASKRPLKTQLHEYAIQGIGMVTLKDTERAPARATEAVTRFIRDTEKVRLLKKMYDDKCQMCGRVIQITSKERYSEVHHIRPLKDRGDDSLENMVVLCPTHHVEFDYLLKGIGSDGTSVVDRTGNTVGHIATKNGHKIHLKNIRYALSEMQQG